MYLQQQNNEGMIVSVFPCLDNVGGNIQIGLPYYAGKMCVCVY